MSLIEWGLIGAAILICAAGLEAYIRRNRPRKSLAETFGAKDRDQDRDVPLGMEATDLDMIRETEHANRVIENRPSVRSRRTNKD